MRTAQGVLLVPMTVNGKHVTMQEVRDVMAALAKLPAADVQLLVQNNIPIELIPVATLGQRMLGATQIDQLPSGMWHPSLVRIAVRARMSGAYTNGEIAQHEVGHVVSVIRRQDRSEDAAISYAKRY
jgi:hypothetical protein